MFRKILFALTVLFVVASCNTATDSTSTVDKNATQYFGEKISTEGALSFNELLDKMDEEKSMQTKVTGKVEAVCKKKGCWANIVSEDGREMTVKFKDYGFFLPLDCEGRSLVMEGEAFREVTSVDELRHLAEDGGATQEEIEKITEPKEELKFMASGVILLEANKQ